MTDETYDATAGRSTMAGSEGAAGWFMTYALALIFLWFGGMKFTDYEASGIAPLVMNNPLTVWMHAMFGIDGAARFIGVYEIATAILIALRPVNARLSAIGGAMAVLCFLVTLTFMFTTPGVAEPAAGGFPALSVLPGQFLLKDLGLLALSFWVLSTSRAAGMRMR